MARRGRPVRPAARRLIDCDFWEQPEAFALGGDCWLVYLGCLLLADDAGRFVLNLDRLRSRSGLRLMGRKRAAYRPLIGHLTRLLSATKIHVYMANSAPIVQVVKWGKYQALWHGRESRLPESGTPILSENFPKFFGIEIEIDKKKKPTSYRKSPSGGRQSASGRSELLKNTTNETPAEVRAKLRADGWALPEEAGE